MRINWRILAAFAVEGVAVACGGRGAARNAIGAPPSVQSQNVLAAAELSRLAPNETVLQAVGRLRPWFLSSRRGVPIVFLDGIPMLDLSVLNTLFASTVSDVTLVRGSTAHSAMTVGGQVVVGDVLLVRTLRRPPIR